MATKDHSTGNKKNKKIIIQKEQTHRMQGANLINPQSDEKGEKWSALRKSWESDLGMYVWIGKLVLLLFPLRAVSPNWNVILHYNSWFFEIYGEMGLFKF